MILLQRILCHIDAAFEIWGESPKYDMFGIKSSNIKKFAMYKRN